MDLINERLGVRVDKGRQGSWKERERKAVQPLYLYKIVPHASEPGLASLLSIMQCGFGSHSTSTKLLFIYLKTCIPWKKMPQDSTVFLKLNPAGWNGEGAIQIAPLSEQGSRLAAWLPPPLKFFSSSEICWRARVKSPLHPLMLSGIRKTALLKAGLWLVPSSKAETSQLAVMKPTQAKHMKQLLLSQQTSWGLCPPWICYLWITGWPRVLVQSGKTMCVIHRDMPHFWQWFPS